MARKTEETQITCCRVVCNGKMVINPRVDKVFLTTTGGWEWNVVDQFDGRGSFSRADGGLSPI